MFKIGLISHLEAPIEGQNSYSPGLQYDARIYADHFAATGTEIIYIKPWGRGDERMDLTGVRAVIGFEEMGDAALLNELRGWKRHTDRFHVCLVPNLEVMQTRGKWSATLENLDLIDIFIAKTPSLVGLIEKWIAHQPKKNANARVMRVFHSTPNRGEVINFAAPRRNIIHFAGASYLKNTLEACHAGIELVRKHGNIFQKFIIKITKWPNKRYAGRRGTTNLVVEDNAGRRGTTNLVVEDNAGRRGTTNLVVEDNAEGIIALDKIAGTFKKVKQLCDENKEIVDLIVGGFMSDEQCAELYNTARLAICCSNAEGFGHSIVDAMRFGCLVVTTDGLPMRDLVPQGRTQGRTASPSENKFVAPRLTASLARPTARRAHNFGIYYEVPAANIVSTAETLDLAGYNEEIAHLCADNYAAIVQKNKEDLILFGETIMSE